MTIQLYDLAAADERILFSPFCWRVRMALLHKGLPFEIVPWRFSARAATAASGHDAVPVLCDGEHWVGDSWDIVNYLEETYPARPALLPPPSGAAHARLVGALCGSLVFPAAVAIAVYQAWRILDGDSQPYFRGSREKMFGCSLEVLNAGESDGRAGLARALKPFDEVLALHDYLGGAAPTHADYMLFGVLKWTDIVSSYDPIDHATPSGRWFDRLQASHGGYAASVPTVRD